MKIVLSILLVFALLTASCSDKTEKQPPEKETTELSQDDLEQTVYITMSGDSYHTENCKYVRMERQAITKEEAIDRGYKACKVCQP
ncbi:hypothetical protein K9N50_01740 [bacterium]|nr:hypothetical protein [bacterium]